MRPTHPFLTAAFVFFTAYTLLYLIQWIASLAISLQRLSSFSARKQQLHRIFPDSIAEKFPVTVIVPAYNESACIVETVQTLLQEDYPHLEIIVVDDGSRDTTAARLIDTFQMKSCPYVYNQTLDTQAIIGHYRQSIGDKQLVLIRKANGGKSDALNCGLNFCRTPYCVIVDADTQLQTGALRIMSSRFALDDRTTVCAGAVGTRLHSQDTFHSLRFFQKLLVLFQHIEYYRTFYMQRILFDQINANVIVSGAFAMFDRDLIVQAGGYRRSTIGEDMELTMRLHAFCLSQNRPYRIAYAPEARCDTQVPYHYRDYIRQRRRWHIGMIQSLKQHLYMIGSRSYGLVGTLSVLYTIVYELLSPLIELCGLVLLLVSAHLHVLNFAFAVRLTLLYILFSLLTQAVLLTALSVYGVEPLRLRDGLQLLGAALLEVFFFHPLNVLTKLFAFVTYRRHKADWNHIRRFREKA